MPDEEGNKPEGEGGEETAEAKAARLESELAETKEELEKMKVKANSFSKVREMTEAEKKKFDEEKKAKDDTIESLRAEIEKNKQSQVDDWYQSALRAAVGDDQKKLEAIKTEYDILNMPNTTRDEVMVKVKKAIKLAGYELKGDLNTLSFSGGKDIERKDKKFSDTDRGKALFDMLAPDLAKKLNQK